MLYYDFWVKIFHKGINIWTKEKLNFGFEKAGWSEKRGQKIEVRFRERLVWKNGAKKQVLQKKQLRVIQQQFIQFEKSGLSAGAKKTVRIKRVVLTK